MPREWTDRDIDDLVRRYAAGETKKQIMASFGIGHPRFIASLAARGLSPVSQGERSRALTSAQASDLVARYIAGKSAQELGPVFGVSGRQVPDYVRRAGEHVRTRSEALALAAERGKWDTPAGRAARSAGMKRRWVESTPEQRRQMVTAAHDAWRGAHHTEKSCCKIAEAKALRGQADSAYETQVAEWLRERGVAFIPQKAVGRYNVDFAIGNVAVEVSTGWARKKEWRPKLARLFNEGWHLFVVWHDTRVPLLPAVADDLVAWLKVLEASPPAGSQYRVVWRSTQVLAAGRADADEVAAVLKSATKLDRRTLDNGAGDQA